MPQRIGFIGAGQMARALGQGFVRAGLAQEDQLTTADISDAATAGFQGEIPGAHAAASNEALCRQCDIVFLAVKPQYLDGVLSGIADAADSETLVISIVAGKTIGAIEAALPAARVVRVMPNTPCLIGAGASAYAMGSRTVNDDSPLVASLMSSVGLAFETPERFLDAVTGLSGSGPAFVFIAIEALSDGGVQAGLPRDLAMKLAAQTVLGSAKLVLESGEHPAVLKDRVASPAGTTIAGLRALEAGGCRAAFLEAVQAAAERSRELGGNA